MRRHHPPPPWRVVSLWLWRRADNDLRPHPGLCPGRPRNRFSFLPRLRLHCLSARAGAPRGWAQTHRRQSQAGRAGRGGRGRTFRRT